MVSGHQGFLGKGITRPFRRVNGDFAFAEGEANVKACVGQILGTRAAVTGTGAQGEVPWRTDFGSKIHLLRHAPNNETRRELARAYVIEALKQWEPRIIVRDVFAEAIATNAGSGRAILLRVLFNLITANAPGNQVVFPKDLVSETTIPL